MSLSNEDKLRLNVLSAQKVKAVRINESSMVLTALTDRGEARIELRPNSHDDVYLREVREFLSEKYLGMPGGYPRHLERWTRMGVTHNSLDKMLLLGEHEAVVSLAYSEHLNADQAKSAWWAYQSPEIARNLLKSEAVVQSDLGAELAQFLFEFIPFEERPLDVVQSVQLCLQKDLISANQKTALWERAKRKNPYLVGFLLADPAEIPTDEAEHTDYTALRQTLDDELAKGNLYAQHYLHFLSSDGRKWLRLLASTLDKPTEPNVVIALFIRLDQYINLPLEPRRGALNIDDAVKQAEKLCIATKSPSDLDDAYRHLTQTQGTQFKAMLVLAQLGDNTLNSVFGGRDATGTVMRKHLEPLTTSIQASIRTLLKDP